jgi:hypothetical protein
MMNAILLASNLAKNRLNDHLIEEFKQKQDMLRPGQKRSEKEKMNETVESIR